ncbi:MAG: beta-ketoacyl synthase [Verrucomicrobia bacterium CG_4_10_14_3_um_filter_43_23]|nr:MAG: beta-ketoacyl synthase [Verrucomicrobia bacterium CG1_02_43_26]PIP59670.1 MAG: beta-ketoacyl synthase [Verrucomicrobia bacterium CG22_combo_CG10-13_8_21_14_all_43_17]PIX58993.1 MAG: beta-ketoacyl synthase [Verrucomicrobia bacterium CG_4_10_14_3_um_filter_43_23]PIY63114.1 MAG: beta-ketoacyl synthase [Verrucomicrobia bacterium CG_4_10_14_0_8_um_filter_43_34]PJA43622.1 MAG: beta-ketoacyl synthase [Verrucomicrobia bacterium CG_4_9_14_3_um_filter_43_20]
MRRVVVTGLGFVTSIGNDKGTVLKNLRELRHGIELFPEFQKDNIPVKLAATIKGFNTSSIQPEDWTGPPDLKLPLSVMRGLSPHVFYSYYAMNQALKEAGLTEEEISNPRTGLYTASSGSTYVMWNHLGKMFEKGVMRCSPTSMIGGIVGTLNFNLTASYHIRGSSVGFASACASSGHALGHAYDQIKQGFQDRMIVVGGEDCTLVNILPFASMRVLSTSTNPDKASRPFDKNRDGFVGTGGAVVAILEEESLAKARGANVYAEMMGWGQGTDGYHPAKPDPEGKGLHDAMSNALKYSGVDPKDIDYINAHATGTFPGDIAELQAIEGIFPHAKYQPAISSTKALTGHGLSLASIMESAFSLLAIKEKFIPGSANIEELDERAKPYNVITETQDKAPRYVLANSSGFGGANVGLIFGQYNG